MFAKLKDTTDYISAYTKYRLFIFFLLASKMITSCINHV